MTDENGTVLGSIIDERTLIATQLAAQLGVHILERMDTHPNQMPDEIVWKFVGFRILKELIHDTRVSMPASIDELFAGLHVVTGPGPGETIQ